MKRSKIALWAAIEATIRVITEYIIYSDAASGIDSKNAGVVIGTAIGLALVTPHLIMFALGALFNWIGWATRTRGFTLTAGILYCVALILGVQNWFMVILPIILAFVGFVKQGKIAADYQNMLYYQYTEQYQPDAYYYSEEEDQHPQEPDPQYYQ
ncbi:MAG: hypothetical protein IJC56_06790 [Clostridia bacterium]|nr:hypothetical protein [Clostridia bacterium]